MREIHTDYMNKDVAVIAAEDYRGEPYRYSIEIQKDGMTQESSHVQFQQGPVRDVGVNGASEQMMLAIVMDRLTYFQTTRHACEENTWAFSYLRAALEHLEARTKRRTDLGIEGTLEPEVPP